MTKKQKITLIIIILIMSIILILSNIILINYINDYNRELSNTKLVEKIEYEGQYKHVFISGKIYTEDPVIYKDKEYLSVKYIKKEYKKHRTYEYEKKWNGRYWYEEKKPIEVWEWEVVKENIYLRPKNKFNNLVFDKNIVYEMNFKLINKKEEKLVREYYYGISNNQEIVMYFKNYDNGEFDEINVYNSYKEALNEESISLVESLLLMNGLMLCIFVIIIGGYCCSIEETKEKAC